MNDFPWIDEQSGQWNRVVLGGLLLPGIATISVDLSEEIDVKKPKGKSGATTTVHGDNPASVSITLQLRNGAELTAWAKAIKALRPKKDAKSAVRIMHPKTIIYGIEAVLISKIKDKENGHADDYSIQIECIEFRPTDASKDATKTETKLEPRKQVLGADIPNKPATPGETNTGPNIRKPVSISVTRTL